MDVTKESLDELSKLISCKLNGYLDKKGGILYSSRDTICAGDVYLIGLNPGGKAGTASKLSDCLCKDCTESSDGNIYRQDNAYWPGTDGHHWPSQLQQKVQCLLEQIVGEEKAKKVFATNLVFMQSPDATAVRPEDADTCWPVHEAFLNIVRPRLILALGNGEDFSPYQYIHSKYGGTEDSEDTYNPRRYKLKGFKTNIAGREISVVGLPNLSRYHPAAEPDNKVINWIKSHWTPENK